MSMCKFQTPVSSPIWKGLFENFINYILELHVELRMQKMRGIGKKKRKKKSAILLTFGQGESK